MYKITLRWVQNHILLNTNKAPVEASVHRFKKTNDIMPWCPSCKYLPNAPKALPAPRKLTKFELCTAVLTSTIRHVQTQYNSAHETTFACNLVSLTRLLKRTADQVQSNCNLLNQYKSITNGKSGANGSGKGGGSPKKT